MVEMSILIPSNKKYYSLRSTVFSRRPLFSIAVLTFKYPIFLTLSQVEGGKSYKSVSRCSSISTSVYDYKLKLQITFSI